MLRKVRRRNERDSLRSKSWSGKVTPQLTLESLERRLLLDVAGWWDELGWRGASGGGATWDLQQDPGEAQLILSSDGDPVLIWVDTQETQGPVDGGHEDLGIGFGEYIEDPIPYSWQVSGAIYARQYVDDPDGANLGWWDLSPGSGDALLSAINTFANVVCQGGMPGFCLVRSNLKRNGDEPFRIILEV